MCERQGQAGPSEWLDLLGTRIQTGNTDPGQAPRDTRAGRSSRAQRELCLNME